MKLPERFDRYLSPVIFTLTFCCLLPFYWPSIVCDMVSYITMSNHIINGNFWSSINSYWSPLMSWLMVPLLACGVNSLFAFKLINLIAAIIILVQLYDLTSSFVANRWFRIAVPLLSLLHLIYHIFNSPTPDILALSIWFYFFNRLRLLVESSNYSTRASIFTGAIATVSYLAKYYNFYAAILLFLLAFIYVHKHRNRLKHISIAFISFMCLSSVWILILYFKFHELTPTSASVYNMSLLRPGGTMHPMQVGTQILPIDYSQFTLSSWEYPPVYNIQNWSPLMSFEDFKFHLLVHVKQNIVYLRIHHFAELLCFVLACLMSWFNRKKYSAQEWFLLATIFAYAAGYMWGITLNRYILFSICLATLWVVITISKLSNTQYKVGIILLVLTGIRTNQNMVNGIATKARDYSGYEYLNFYKQSTQIHPVSNNRLLCSERAWHPATIFSFYTHSLLFDVLNAELLKNNRTKIQTLGIDYYLCLPEEVPEHLKHKVVLYDRWALIDIR